MKMRLSQSLFDFLLLRKVVMQKVKRCVITRGVKEYIISDKYNDSYLPKNGDVAVFEVLSIGKHKSVQAVDETATAIYPGDYILAAFGTRYASNQFEGYLPSVAQAQYQILGQGGVVGVLHSMHTKFEDIGATEVRLVGYALDESQQVINTRFAHAERVPFASFVPKDYAVYLSIGASMDSGKTTTAAFFSRGAMLAGKRVAYIKLTGTAFSKDRRVVRDCGAVVAADFSHCGYPSTFMCEFEEILDVYATLMRRVEVANPDIVVVEIADGLLQLETGNLLKYESFMRQVTGVILSCPDSLSVYGGLQVLASMGITPVLLSGLFTASPLLVNEVEAISTIPVFGIEDFMREGALSAILGVDAARPLLRDVAA